MNDQEEERIEKFNSAVAHILWTILVSMITALVVTLLATGSAGL